MAEIVLSFGARGVDALAIFNKIAEKQVEYLNGYIEVVTRSNSINVDFGIDECDYAIVVSVWKGDISLFETIRFDKLLCVDDSLTPLGYITRAIDRMVWIIEEKERNYDKG